MSRLISIGLILMLFNVASISAQMAAPHQDSVVVSAGVQALIDATDHSKFQPEYEFFFKEAKNFPPVGYDTLVSVLSRLEGKGFRPELDFKNIFGLLSKAKEEYDYDFKKLDDLIQVIGELGVTESRTRFNGYLSQLGMLLDGVISNERTGTVYLTNAKFNIELNKPEVYTGRHVTEYVAPSTSSNRNTVPQGPLERPMYEMYEELGVVVHIESADLMIANYIDTFAIRGTEGYYLIQEGLLKGQDGRLTWENRDYSAETRFARLNTYEFPIRSKEINFTNVYFMDRNMLEEPANGDLSIVLSLSQNAQESYPQFISYAARNRVAGLGNDNLQFTGGLHIKGKSTLTNTKFEQASELIGTKDGTKLFKAISNNFSFNDSKGTVTAANANVVLYHGNDSIVNSAVNFSYDYVNEYLVADTDVEGFRNSPFRSSYFDVQVMGDRLAWDVKTDSLDLNIVAAKREIPLTIESKEFFSSQRYRDLSQLFGFHPLTLAVEMAPKAGYKFFVKQMSDRYRLRPDLVRRTMKFLKANGFVEFDEIMNEVTVLPKAIHYYRAYSTQVLEDGYDYDDLLIPSIIGNRPNATINFDNGTMTVRGVDDFVISDSLDVVITPDNGEIQLLENRNIAFNGSLNAGNFKFNGTRSVFDYDSFRIDLNRIDNIELAVELEQGQREALSNQLTNTSGTLWINDPTNKSALRSIPTYPIFKSQKQANVSFDKEDVLNGAYDSTVYFDVPPFELDSLADADPTKYTFAGTFYSNGILPDFDAALKAMPDNSFGFIEPTPLEGFKMYETSARIIGDIKLDKEGITSTGYIKYLTGEFELERSVFFLDSLVAESGLKATIGASDSAGVSYPDVQMEEFSMNWLARSDSMILTNKNEAKPFQLFNELATLKGDMILGTTGLIGAGEMDLGASNLVSDSITFQTLSFQSQHSDFSLKAAQSARPILSSKDVFVDYDLEIQEATIEPEVAGVAALEFPYAQFKTSIPTAKWDIEGNTIIMSKPDSTPLNDSFFYSTNTELDSLVFNATNAQYDIESSKLTVKGIPYIAVSDARIIPEGDSLIILENSKIDRLYNAKIEFDTANNFHKLFDANIDIISRNVFRGKATYELVNALKDTFAIEFNEFVPVPADEKNGIPAHTRASGYVSGNQGVKVSSGFIFEGEIVMSAYKKALALNGAVKLDLARLSDRNIWIEYSSNDDISEVVVPFDEALTRQGQPLNAGLHFNARGDIYMSFITEKQDYMDYDFFVPKGGNLYFDPSFGAFRIDNPLKQANPNNNYAGSMFSYDEVTQDVTFEGKLSFLGGPRGTNIQAAGKGKGNLDSATYEIDAMFALSFGLSPEGLGEMAKDLKNIGDNVGVPRALEDRSELVYRVAEFIGDEATRKWDMSYRTVPMALFEASSGLELQKDIVITDAKLKWSKQLRAFYSEGKISLSNISNVKLDQVVDGFIEVRKTSEGDIYTLLIELTDGTWYYFSYDGYTMATFSSNEAYNAMVSTFNTGKYKAGNFNTLLISQAEVIQWVTDYRKLYYGIDEPYRLLMAGDSNQRLKKRGAVEGDGF